MGYVDNCIYIQLSCALSSRLTKRVKSNDSITVTYSKKVSP